MGYEDELQRARAKREAAKRGETPKKSSRQVSVERVERSAGISMGGGQGHKKGGRRRPSARQKARRRRIRNIILLAVAAVILLGVGLVYAFVQSKFDKFQKPDFKEEEVVTNELDEQTVKNMEGYTTIALFGVDARDNDSLGKGVHADVDMIASINNKTGEIKLVSVYRDTYLNIKGDSSYNKLTQAYFEGGPKQAIDALNKNLDLNITKYATFNWAAVATAINVFGGVDIDISKSEFKYINAFITETVKGTGIGTTQLKSPGMNHLDGVQAVAYARLRKMDTDYQRTERQRLVIKLTMDKAKEASLTTLLGTVDLIFPMISTNVDMGDCIDLAKNFSRYYLGETTGFPFDKDSKVMGKKGDCVIPLNLETNVQQLHQFLFGGNEDGSPYTPSSTVKTISKKIINDSGWDKNSTSSGGGSDKASSTKAPETQAPTASVTEVIVDGESNGEGEFQVPTDENGNPIPMESGESMEFVEGGESGSAFESGSGSETQGPGFDGPGGSGTRPGQTTEEYGPGVTKPSTEPGTLAPEETLPSSSEGTPPTPGSTGTSTTPGTPGPSGSTTTPGSPTTPGTPGTPGTSGSQTTPGSPTAPGTSGSSVTPGSGSGNSPAGNGPGGSPVSSTAASPEVPQGPQGSTQAPPEAQVNIETVPPRAQ